MTRLLFCLVLLSIGLFSPHEAATQNRPGHRSPTYSQFKWEDERVTGESRNVSVRSLLEELSSREDFELVIIGELNQKVHVTFDHLTLEQSIKKVMRVTDLSYCMILDSAGSSGKGSSYRVKKLIICQKGTGPRPSRVSQRPPRGYEKRSQPVVKRPSPNEEEAEVVTRREPSPDTMEREKLVTSTGRLDFEGSPEALKKYVDTLSSQGAITREEYEEILEEMEEGEKQGH